MANDILHALIRANLAGTAVALVLLAARGPLRKGIGPTAVYALWLAVPAAGFASLLPARIVVTVLRAGTLDLGKAAGAAHDGAVITSDWSLAFIAVWAAGAAFAAAAIAWRHYWFLVTLGRLEAKDGVVRAVTSTAGPAVIGLISPRILVPGDFETRFSPRERSVILAHETIHLTRGDSRINAVVLLLQCLNWFNPVAHIAARGLRLDQELACDAGVMRQFPMARRSYAEAMLKSQMDAAPLPAGCYWQARGVSALARRLTLLNAEPLSRNRLMGGVALVGALTVCAGLVAWSAQPARQKIVLITEPARSAVALSGPAGGAAAPRSLPAAPSGLTLGRKDAPLLAVNFPSRAAPAAQPGPSASKPQPAQPAIQWSMPMPPDPEQDEVYSPSSGFVSPDRQTVAQASGNGPPVQTVSYRSGDYQMKSDFTPLDGRIQVSTQLFKSGVMVGAGSATTAPGETAYVALSNGQFAQVAPGKTAYLITPSTLHATSADLAPS